MVSKIRITDSNNTTFTIANDIIDEKDLTGGVNTPPVIRLALNSISCKDNPNWYKAYLGANGSILYVKYAEDDE